MNIERKQHNYLTVQIKIRQKKYCSSFLDYKIK